MSPWRKWKTQWLHWEFWPFWLFYFPVYFYFLWLALRERSFFFFTATNPLIDFGGMLGEKKSEIFKTIPQKYYPKTILITKSKRAELANYGSEMGYPFIAKPDIGERGKGVEIINNKENLLAYQAKTPVNFLLQKMVSYPLELGVFYIRHPKIESGQVTSIVQKEFLSVTGDGHHSARDLLKKSERGSLQIDVNHERFKDLMKSVPNNGEVVIIEPIGNHCRGTKFLNANNEIDENLSSAIDKLAKRIPDFYYGRFDLKCQSFEDLRRLENFKIVELNGVGAEPAHIYQPGFSLMKAYKIVFWHYNQMAHIAHANRQLGNKVWSLRQGMKKIADIRNYNRQFTGS